MRSEIQELDSRIARLESRNRWLSVAVLLFAGLLLAGAAHEPRSIRAESLQLLGADGELRAELAFRDGEAGLYVYADDGSERVAVISNAEGSGLFVKDAAGYTRVGAAQFAHGGGGFALHGTEGKGGAVLFYKTAGSLRFFDADGTVTNAVLAEPQ